MMVMVRHLMTLAASRATRMTPLRRSVFKMNDDFENMFSMRGAYIDDDGIEIGSNDVAGSQPSTPVRQRPAIVHQSSHLPKRFFWIGVALAIVVVVVFLLRL